VDRCKNLKEKVLDVLSHKPRESLYRIRFSFLSRDCVDKLAASSPCYDDREVAPNTNVLLSSRTSVATTGTHHQAFVGLQDSEVGMTRYHVTAIFGMIRNRDILNTTIEIGLGIWHITLKKRASRALHRVSF
jgi:hypothetical protein